MGVSGSGITTVGRSLAARLDCDFLEGDRRHPSTNISKMARGIALQDSDRHQWLLAITQDLQHAVTHQRETVIACSALKQSYRQQLTIVEQVQLVWLSVPRAELQQRLRQRPNHYMSDTLLESQLNAFEPPTASENMIQVNGTLPPQTIVDNILTQTIHRYPTFSMQWWNR
ncbi:MAG: AAA family ATPase [Merismopedia sp. SIO2A8]|nr:AAA family ATPase [Merismopedia sp. SIO2A8]